MPHTPAELMHAGYEARKEGRLKEARADFSESMRLSREGHDQSHLIRALVGLGQIERDLKNNAAALQHYREAADLCEERHGVHFAHIIRHLADLLREERRLGEAEPYYQQALKIYRCHPAAAPLDLANAIRGYALLKEDAGKTAEAGSLWKEARALYQSTGVPAGVEEASRRISQLGDS